MPMNMGIGTLATHAQDVDAFVYNHCLGGEKMRKSIKVTLIAAMLCAGLSALGLAVASTAIEKMLVSPNPLEAHESLWAEELTWMEMRDKIKSGTKTIIIGTGGIEQNGPYVAAGKHNYVLQAVLPFIAREIGGSLIAPIVKFVPEGDIGPTPSEHMIFPGTISVEQATFEALLTDICRSYKAHGFVDIILLGDSGGNQEGMAKVAETLNKRWATEIARVHYLPEYYFEDQWSYEFLKSQGITQKDLAPQLELLEDRPTAWRNFIHDDIYYEAQIAVIDPRHIRVEERKAAGLFTLHGVNLSPLDETIELGKKLAAYRATITAKAFEESVKKFGGRTGAICE
jgi:hypothetical protein